jgi:hypothetical protein
MAIVEFDLSRHAQALGGKPGDHFVDEHDHVFRVIAHATGNVVGVLRPDGTLGPYRPAPHPGAPPVKATLTTESAPATATGKAAS